MASPASAKKQIVESIKEASNILVTVNSSPTVDELAAALGLTLFLNKLGKHATAVASGQMPSVIDFLEPDKTFEGTADSLRDFIISLDKDKADHLRYKLEGDVVKIFITPYRAKIDSSDLEFSQGDYNVELVLALNVVDEAAMDIALESHGKILHDATVITLTAGDIESSLGTIAWHERSASGVSEMASDLVGLLKTTKATLDGQMSTALLTGVVAATDRFRNELTSSKVMTTAAELMAAGANQQLIVNKLEEEIEIEESIETGKGAEPDKTTDSLSLREARHSGKDKKNKKTEDPDKESAGMMKISHAREGDMDEIAEQVVKEDREEAAHEAKSRLSDKEDTIKDSDVDESQVSGSAVDTDNQPSEEAETRVGSSSDEATRNVEEEAKLDQVSEEAREEVAKPEHPIGEAKGTSSASTEQHVPSVGGALNATTEQAAADKHREANSGKNTTILTHGKPISDPTDRLIQETPLNAAMGPNDEPPLVDIFSTPPSNQSDAHNVPQPSAGSSVELPPVVQATDSADVELPQVNTGLPPALLSAGPTLADIEADALSHAPATVAMPPMPDFSNLPPAPTQATIPEPVADSPMPHSPPAESASAPTEFNPGQFQIPPQ